MSLALTLDNRLQVCYTVSVMRSKTARETQMANAKGFNSWNKCDFCGAVVGDAFECPNCGQPVEVERECPACGAAASADATECDNCGEPFNK